jgi:hypothetical protein
MPGGSSAEQVRLAVQQLAADAAIARSDELLPVHRQFVRSAARRRFSNAIVSSENIDTETGRSGEIIEMSRKTTCQVFKYVHLLKQSIGLMWQLRAKLTDTSLVGIWMPPCAESVVANLAVAFCGKTVVNLNSNWLIPRFRPRSINAACDMFSYQAI